MAFFHILHLYHLQYYCVWKIRVREMYPCNARLSLDRERAHLSLADKRYLLGIGMETGRYFHDISHFGRRFLHFMEIPPYSGRIVS